VKGRWAKWLAIAVAVLAVFLFWNVLPIKDWSLAFSRFAEDQGGRGILVYGLVYVVATVVLFPCSTLTFAAGMAYGIWAFPIVILSSVIGASLAFVISRRFLKERVSRFMEQRPGTSALKAVLEREGWMVMLLFRISPVIPFTINNYFMGTLRVSFATYFWVTLLGTIPGTALYIYLGTLGRDYAEEGDFKLILMGIGALATYAVLERVLKARAKIAERKCVRPTSS